MEKNQFLVAAVLFICCFVRDTSAQRACQCGWFVDPMWGQLSNLDPLDYLPGTTVSNRCALQECQDYCRVQGIVAQGVDLNAVVGGKARGQTYCERIYALLGGADINNEPLVILSRVPDCDQYFVWGTTKVFTSTVTYLCCTTSGNYVAC